MSYANNKNLSTMFIMVGLLILSIILSACGAGDDQQVAPVGLRTEATNPVLDLNNEVAPAIAEPVVTIIETQSGGPATEPALSNGQAQFTARPEHTFDPATAPELSVEERESLVYMREEEKLARDVYLTLYDQWGLNVFQNIAGSEQAHMDSVLTIMDSYGLADPTANMAVGEFSNPDFQQLYAQLVEQGRLSSVEALKVAAVIEELDIVDLDERLLQTSNEYIVQVFTNLRTGSENHLRAFVSNLERQSGETYQPVYLSDDAYQAIMSVPANGGSGNGRQNGGNSGNGGGNGFGGGNGRRNGQQGTDA